MLQVILELHSLPSLHSCSHIGDNIFLIYISLLSSRLQDITIGTHGEQDTTLISARAPAIAILVEII